MSIVKSLRNMFSSPEEKKATMWIEEYNENSTALTSMLTEEADFSILKGYQDFDASAAWNKIDHLIEEDQTPVRQLPILMKVAAAGAVLLIALFAIKPYISGSTIDTGLMAFNYDAKKELNLPDGSSIFFDKGSSVEYNQFQFTDERQIAFEGRAYFDIAKSEQGKNFVISSGEIDVEILGTEFEINTLSDTPQVIVTEGKVKVSKGSQSVIITANESVSLKDGKIVKSDVNSKNVASWMSGELRFEDESISAVIQDLSQHYNVVIEVDANSDLSCPYTSSYKDSSLETILEEIAVSTGGSAKVTANKVSLSNVSCSK